MLRPSVRHWLLLQEELLDGASQYRDESLLYSIGEKILTWWLVSGDHVVVRRRP